MKLMHYLVAAALLSLAAPAPAHAAKYCVWNIMADGAQETFGNGVWPWRYRSQAIFDTLEGCDVAFLQEVEDSTTYSQMTDLRNWAAATDRKMCVGTHKFHIFNMRNVTVAKRHIPMHCKSDLVFPSGFGCQRAEISGRSAYNCHLDNHDPGNTREINKMISLASSLSSYIFAGDFNTNSHLVKASNKTRIDALSKRSAQPLPLDKLIASDLCGPVTIGTPRGVLSDHPSLEAHLVPCGLMAVINLLLLD